MEALLSSPMSVPLIKAAQLPWCVKQDIGEFGPLSGPPLLVVVVVVVVIRVVGPRMMIGGSCCCPKYLLLLLFSYMRNGCLLLS